MLKRIMPPSRSCASNSVTPVPHGAGTTRREARPPITATFLPVLAAGAGRVRPLSIAQSPTYCFDRVDADEIVDLVAIAANSHGRADAPHEGTDWPLTIRSAA